MRNIKDWKLFEGHYQDLITKINSLKSEISKTKETYLDEVKECLWDLIDDWGAVHIDEDDLSDHRDSKEDLESTFEIKITGKLKSEFINTLIECNSKCESYIGKGIKIDWIGAVTRTGYIYALTKLLENINSKSDFTEKMSILESSYTNYYNDDPFDATNGIVLIITV